MEGNGFEGEEAVGNCLGSLVDQGSRDSHRYYLSRRTVLEMLRDRGYDVPLSEINLSLHDFRSIHGQDPDVGRLRISVTHRSHPSKRMVVIFCGPGMIKVNVIRSIATQIVNKDSLSGLILILQNQITNQALKAVDLFPFKVELFQITDLLVNITKHVLIPNHHVLTDQEKERVLKKYSIEEKQHITHPKNELAKSLPLPASMLVRGTYPRPLVTDEELPRMVKKDAIARYYGLERGQVVKVTYSGEITESHVTYRCVW